MLKAFIFISCFLDLHKKQEKIAKSFIFSNLFPVLSSFAFTLHKGFRERPLFKTTFCDVLRHVYTVKQTFRKIPDKNCPKIKTLSIVMVVA